MKKFLSAFLIILIGLILGVSIYYGTHSLKTKDTKHDENNSNIMPNDTTSEIKEEGEKTTTTISINAVGDCTIGKDPKFGYAGTFNEYYDQYGASYFFSKVQDLFKSDDLTIVNLESTFTESNQKEEKAFNFKAPQEYVNILKEGHIEAVNIANNHTFDYGDEGLSDTIKTLKEAKVNYFGNEDVYLFEKAGIKIGLDGLYTNYDPDHNEKVIKRIQKLKDMGANTIIMSFHWGVENTYKFNKEQQEIAHLAIDNGADLVIGHHPHVLQGLEEYKNKFIVYSLGNFSFGGNRNPKDKDTMVFHLDLEYLNGKLMDTKMKIYPASLSGVKNKNDYRPILVTGLEKTRILEKIKKYSYNMDNIYFE